MDPEVISDDGFYLGLAAPARNSAAMAEKIARRNVYPFRKKAISSYCRSHHKLCKKILEAVLPVKRHGATFTRLYR